MEDTQILFALGVVVLGYFVQYWYAKKLESQKHQQNLRTNAYVDFIKGATGMAITQKNKSNKEQEFIVLLADAKARISIYGSKEVIESIKNSISYFLFVIFSPDNSIIPQLFLTR